MTKKAGMVTHPDGEVKKYAVIGNPIKHSLSPVMHTAAFRALGVNATYEALEVENLSRAYDYLKENYAGINVTIPHKETIVELLDEKEMAADLIGAVNCVKFGRKAMGFNTDLHGAISALKDVVPHLREKNILVLGAGGAARAIIFGCLMEGANVTIYNRTVRKAEALAKEIGEKMKDIEVQRRPDPVGFDILINATSAGMYPKVDETPLTSGIPSNMVVMDIVYNPLETRLLRKAKEAGARTISGLEMFVRQGAESLRIWGYDPPVSLMREVVTKELMKND